MRESLSVIDKLIDSLMADRVSGDIMGDSAGDLLRASAQMQLLNDVGHNDSILEPHPLSSVLFAFNSTLMGTMRQIDVVDGGFIPFELSADGAFMTPHNPRNITEPLPLCPKDGYDITFLTG
jgi:hypothetical protein